MAKVTFEVVVETKHSGIHHSMKQDILRRMNDPELYTMWKQGSVEVKLKEITNL